MHPEGHVHHPTCCARGTGLQLDGFCPRVITSRPCVAEGVTGSFLPSEGVGEARGPGQAAAALLAGEEPGPSTAAHVQPSTALLRHIWEGEMGCPRAQIPAHLFPSSGLGHSLPPPSHRWKPRFGIALGPEGDQNTLQSSVSASSLPFPWAQTEIELDGDPGLCAVVTDFDTRCPSTQHHLRGAPLLLPRPLVRSGGWGSGSSLQASCWATASSAFLQPPSSTGLPTLVEGARPTPATPARSSHLCCLETVKVSLCLLSPIFSPVLEKYENPESSKGPGGGTSREAPASPAVTRRPLNHVPACAERGPGCHEAPPVEGVPAFRGSLPS
nr:uncharacterized protein LOC114090915 [Marmota flaviventris]